MSTVELRKKLKEKIDNLNKDYLLQELLSIIELESNKLDSLIIPHGHKERLKISLEQLANGQTTDHPQVIKEMKDGLTS